MSRAANMAVVVAIGLLVAFGILLQLLPSGLERAPASVRSAEPDGRQVVFDLLRELGFRTRAWTESPGALRASRDLLIVPRVPEAPPGYGDDDSERSVGAAAGARRLRDPRHYARFVEQGGTLLMAVDADAFADFAELCELDDLSELNRVAPRAGEDRTLEAVLPTGERFEIEWEPGFRFEPSDSLEVELADELGDALAVSYAHGDGRFVLFISDLDFLDNRHIEDAGNALLAVRFAERFAESGSVSFDEYVLGGWTPDSAVSLAFAPNNFPFSVHLLALALLLVWASAWARQFPRDPVALEPVSAMMRARGLARVAGGERRWDLLAGMLRDGVLRRLARRLGTRVAHHAPARLADEPVGAPVERVDADTMRAVVASFFGATDGEAQRAAERLFTKPVANEDDLERLGYELKRLEQLTLAHGLDGEATKG